MQAEVTAVEAPKGRALTKAEIDAAPAGETIAWGWMRPHPKNGMPFGSIWSTPDQAKAPEKEWGLVPVEVRKVSGRTRGEVGYFDPDRALPTTVVGIVWNTPRPTDIPVQVVVVYHEVTP